MGLAGCFSFGFLFFFGFGTLKFFMVFLLLGLGLCMVFLLFGFFVSSFGSLICFFLVLWAFALRCCLWFGCCQLAELGNETSKVKPKAVKIRNKPWAPEIEGQVENSTLELHICN